MSNSLWRSYDHQWSDHLLLASYRSRPAFFEFLHTRTPSIAHTRNAIHERDVKNGLIIHRTGPTAGELLALSATSGTTAKPVLETVANLGLRVIRRSSGQCRHKADLTCPVLEPCQKHICQHKAPANLRTAGPRPNEPPGPQLQSSICSCTTGRLWCPIAKDAEVGVQFTKPYYGRVTVDTVIVRTWVAASQPIGVWCSLLVRAAGRGGSSGLCRDPGPCRVTRTLARWPRCNATVEPSLS